MKVNDIKMMQFGLLRLPSIVGAIIVVLTSQLVPTVAYANAGFGVNSDISGKTIAVPTYYASSPQGWQPALDINNLPIINPSTGNPYTAAEACAANFAKTGSCIDGSVVPMVNTGAALRKFVDPLAGAYHGLDGVSGENSMGIPLAIADKWVDSNGKAVNGNNDDFYEIAVVEYKEKMHSDLANPTRLRGYVQIETDNIRNNNVKDITGIFGSEHIPATYPDGTPIFKWKQDSTTGVWKESSEQVYFVHAPHYLGPTILAERGKAVRILAHNYLPYMDAQSVSHGSIKGNGGELPVPVDEYIAGGGPVINADGTLMLDKNNKPIKFSQNRTTIHWHGGDTPWTGDGTPHQWFAPAGDVSWSITNAMHPNGMGAGDSFRNVADMPDPGQGSQTLYFPNNLSGRLMFYHDHTSGLTRVNVYEGEAAGYVVYDPVELKLAADALHTTLDTKDPNTSLPVGLLDSIGIPLVIQDKQFVPKNMGPNALATNGQVQSQDAKWDLDHWGQEGDLFFPHVYEVNQDPNSFDGTNPVGRWDWGPWFWPVFPAQYSLPSGSYGDVTTTPEAFLDTPVVNGQAYPTMTVEPKTYRFRILSVANDRAQNLGLYEAVDGAGNVCDAITTPTLNPVAPGETSLPAACTEVRMVPATTTSNLPVGWPTDGRAGGVPDPLTAGPDIVQIGNEGGLLPAPAIWPAQPVTFDQNVRSMTILNVLKHQLLLGGAERADVLIDFSKYAGKTLILYNDAPAPMPGFDPRIDYYTGVGDQSQGGGAYDTLPGYGPNTRTIMQIKVANSTPATPLDTDALAKALPVAYAATQPKPNIPEMAYNTVFPGTATQNNYAQIYTGSLTAPDFKWTTSGYQVGSVTIVDKGVGYRSTPKVTINGTVSMGGTPATAKATISGGTVTGITVTPGSGYLDVPTVSLSGGNPTTAASVTIASTSATVTNAVHVINKAIQELFDPVYGRMNATLAVELPYSSATVATTIPLAYIDAPIESMDAIRDGETQIWKITHNGVDSHPVHFHLVNVQVINRVDWAGVVKPPEANEVGWKETLRMNPLEDVYVAVKAVHPVTPFGVPKSARVLDPSQAVGSQIGFTQIDQLTGQTPTFQTQLVNGVMTDVPTTAYTNQLTDFDNEYVWHCHILGHEENDFMRPFVFHPTVVRPDAPGKVAIAGSTISWTDPTPFGGKDSNGVPTAGLDLNGVPASSPKNEVGFKVMQYVTIVTSNPAYTTTTTTTARSGVVSVTQTNVPANTTTTHSYSPIANVPANTTSWTGSLVPSTQTTNVDVAAQTVTRGRSITSNPAYTATVTTTTGAPYVVVAYNAAGDSQLGTANTASSGSTIAVLGGSAAADAAAVAAIQAATAAVTAQAAVDAAAAAAATANAATNTIADAALAAAVALPPVAFNVANAVGTPGAVTLRWANNPLNVNPVTGYTNVTGFTLYWTGVDMSGSSLDSGSTVINGLTTGATVTGLTSGGNYTFSLAATSQAGKSTEVTTTVPNAP